MSTANLPPRKLADLCFFWANYDQRPAPAVDEEKEDKKPVRHVVSAPDMGATTASLLTASHSDFRNFSAHLHDLSQSVAIHILPGEYDPLGNNPSFQQALSRAIMFGHASSFGCFACETNTTYSSTSDPPCSPLAAETSKWTRRFWHPRGLCLSERYCQHLDSLSMTCPSTFSSDRANDTAELGGGNAQVASHRT
jgi:hypothetical protein